MPTPFLIKKIKFLSCFSFLCITKLVHEIILLFFELLNVFLLFIFRRRDVLIRCAFCFSVGLHFQLCMPLYSFRF